MFARKGELSCKEHSDVPKKKIFCHSCKLKPNLNVTRFTGSHLFCIGSSGFRLRQAYAVTSRSP